MPLSLCFGEDVQTARGLFVRVKALGLRQFFYAFPAPGGPFRRVSTP